MPETPAMFGNPEVPAGVGSPSLIWYGERGVVNALVTALATRDIEAGVKRFLREVVWADGDHPWIDRITGATLIVEVGLSEFGDPDLIVVCQADGQRFVVVIEAKVIPYLANALSNAKGMVKGKNSNINRQLTLRYRFAAALAAWDGQSSTIVEPEPLYRAYARPPAHGGLADPNPGPRKLGQREVTRRILAPQRIHSLPPENYHLVAMTWDREPFFRQPRVNRDLLPLLLTPGGDDAWDTVRPSVGWVGYRAIKERVAPGREFDTALGNMVRQTEPPEAGATPDDRVDTTNIDSDFKADGRETPLTQLLARIVESAGEWFGDGAVKRHAGSVSVTLGRKVLVKLIPRHPGPDTHLLLGLSDELSPRGWSDLEWIGPLLAGEGRSPRPFYFFRLPDPSRAGEAVAIADSVFGQLAERMGLDDS